MRDARDHFSQAMGVLPLSCSFSGSDFLVKTDEFGDLLARPFSELLALSFPFSVLPPSLSPSSELFLFCLIPRGGKGGQSTV